MEVLAAEVPLGADGRTAERQVREQGEAAPRPAASRPGGVRFCQRESESWGLIPATRPPARSRDEDGRVGSAGKLPPMPIRRLPEAPQAAHFIGPAMILVALGRRVRRDLSLAAPGDRLRPGHPLAVHGRRARPDRRDARDGALCDGHRRVDLLRRGTRGEAVDVDVLRDRDPGLHLAGSHLRRRRGARGADRHPVAGVRHPRADRHRRSCSPSSR